ncbi:MAG: hypothetical protein ACM358_05040 [Gemmatimonadota bacterium]
MGWTMKNLDDGPDGLNEEAWVREWKRAKEETRLRAAKLPAKVSRPTPVIRSKP